MMKVIVSAHLAGEMANITAETTLIKPRLWQFLSIMESVKTVKCDLSLIYTFLDISGFCVKF